jgi:hypothetical protein
MAHEEVGCPLLGELRSSVRRLTLSSRMSVHTSLMNAKRSAFVPLLPASLHLSGFLRSAGLYISLGPHHFLHLRKQAAIGERLTPRGADGYGFWGEFGLEPEQPVQVLKRRRLGNRC